ncbi:MAG: hypothetical protein M3N13_02975 [Candidatus Eremiobacteraeota bacterium]|nr:hypothetical protein [Candidatus Eremiobacteraeota bacterium]
MPFLALVHLRELRCADCGAQLAEAGARSFVVDANKDPFDVPQNGAPQEMTVEIECPRGHATIVYVPNEIGAEETLITPVGAPIGRDAVVIS